MSVAVGQTPETRNVRGVALYMALVARFPLRPLRSERDLDRATKIANELAVRGNLSRWEHDYLDVLSDLIEAYEAAHHPIPDLSGPEMLRHLLTERGISQASAARAMGMRPRRFPTFYVASGVSDASTSRCLPPTSTSPLRSSYPSPPETGHAQQERKVQSAHSRVDLKLGAIRA